MAKTSSSVSGELSRGQNFISVRRRKGEGKNHSRLCLFYSSVTFIFLPPKDQIKRVEKRKNVLCELQLDKPLFSYFGDAYPLLCLDLGSFRPTEPFRPILVVLIKRPPQSQLPPKRLTRFRYRRKKLELSLSLSEWIWGSFNSKIIV